jgi:hypothetical protein
MQKNVIGEKQENLRGRVPTVVKVVCVTTNNSLDQVQSN